MSTSERNPQTLQGGLSRASLSGKEREKIPNYIDEEVRTESFKMKDQSSRLQDSGKALVFLFQLELIST